MSDKETKMEKVLSEEVLPSFLRDLAAKLETENDQATEEWPVEINGFSKIKISLNRYNGQVTCKLKLKKAPAGPASAEDKEKSRAKEGEDDKKRYKKLKKRMKNYFKEMSSSIEEGKLPARQTADNFLADAKTMTEFPDKGEEFYKEFLAACYEFQGAYEQGDVSVLQEKFKKLEEVKDKSHLGYK